MVPNARAKKGDQSIYLQLRHFAAGLNSQFHLCLTFFPFILADVNTSNQKNGRNSSVSVNGV